MASTTKVPLGGATFARKWYLDYNAGTYGAPSWTGVFGILQFDWKWNQQKEDGSDLDASGWTTEDVTALGATINLVLDRKTKAADATAYDVGQEALRAECLSFGDANKIDLRWYEVTSSGPIAEAYRGYFSVDWQPQGGDMKARDKVNVTLTSRGVVSAITHPDDSQAVPTLTSITPATGAAAGGTLVEIHGTGFFLAGVDDIVATTGIKFGGSGGTNATSWITESDNVVFAVAPAHAEGTVAVVVYNSAGISTVTQNYVYTS